MGLYEETGRSGCALTDRELQEFRNKPTSERPSWQEVTNCHGANTSKSFLEVGVHRAKSGMKKPYVYAPFSEEELPIEAWSLAHQMDCDYPAATEEYSNLWEDGEDAE
jgi:hypothetical protein